MNSRQSHIIRRPLLNEKTIGLTGLAKPQYTFEVALHATKTEIRHAIEQILAEMYPKNKYSVVKVNTSAMRDRFRQRKRHGRAPQDSKKAIVTIEGDPIDLFQA